MYVIYVKRIFLIILLFYFNFVLFVIWDFRISINGYTLIPNNPRPGELKRCGVQILFDYKLLECELNKFSIWQRALN